MTKKYTELLAQRNEIDNQIKSLRDVEMANVVTAMKELIVEYTIQPNEIFSKSELKACVNQMPKKKRQAKYRCPTSGATWSGLGRTPNWIKGQDKDQYLINTTSN